MWVFEKGGISTDDAQKAIEDMLNNHKQNGFEDNGDPLFFIDDKLYRRRNT